ncbi:MATE family efflux transporter [Peptoniphilus mikwangii]|uniref:MATE family efflux transporter n=1 Tax=Peptoniphilus mikwangii TaxID=1354300 RepID=UPI0004194F0A|nr:MATE family efflux transporter [Peptoniphilus mikwangii]
MKLKIDGNVNFTEGSIASGIIYFAIPLLLSNFLQQLYNTADLMIVGNFAGKGPMASVGATGPVANLLIGLFLGLTTGASVIVSQFYGMGNRKKLHSCIHTSYAVAIVGGIVLSVSGYFLSSIILSNLNTPREIMDDSIRYMRIFFLGVTPLLIYNMGAGILRSTGDSRRPFNFLCISAIVNIILDVVFVVYFKLSVVGAGWATFISQVVSAILVTYNLMVSDRIFKLNPKYVKFYRDTIGKILKIGIPIGVQSSVISLSNVLIQSKINTFGANAIAGISAESRIDGFIFMALQAVSLSATTFAGQNFGAGRFDRIKKGIKTAMLLMVGTALFLSAISIIFAKILISVFNSDPEVINYGSECLYYIASTCFIFGISEVFGGFVRGAGKAIVPMAISIVSMCGLRMVWIYVALGTWNNIEIIYLSYPISWIVTCILNGLYYFFGKWNPQERFNK